MLLNVLIKARSSNKEIKDHLLPMNKILFNIRFYERTLTGKMKIILIFKTTSQSSTLLMQKLLEKNIKILSFSS